MARIRVSTWDLSFEPGIWSRRLEFGRQGWDLGPRLQFGPQGLELGLKSVIGPQVWNLGFRAGLRA